MVCLDSDWGVIEQQSQENLDVGVDSDNLAYVIVHFWFYWQTQGGCDANINLRPPNSGKIEFSVNLSRFDLVVTMARATYQQFPKSESVVP